MLIFNISRVMSLRGVDKPFAFLTKRGIYRTIASNLINSRVAHVKIAHLEMICRTLNCTPNDLFEWKPEANDTLGENHALNSLKRDKTAARIAQAIKDIPVEKLERIEELLDQLKDQE